MNHVPALLLPQNETMSGNIILRQTYPGNHEALIDMILYTKHYQLEHPRLQENGKVESNGVLGHARSNIVNGITTNGVITNSMTVSGHPTLISEHNKHTSEQAVVSTEMRNKNSLSLMQDIGDFKTTGIKIADVNDPAVGTYDAGAAKLSLRQRQIKRFGQCPYHGAVLDPACGVGGVGILIKKAGNNATIHGIDILPLCLRTSQVIKYHSSTVVGFLQDAIMSEGHYDRIVYYGALHFLTRAQSNVTISHMFMLARKFVEFDVDDVTQEYIDKIIDAYGEGLRNHTLIKAYHRFDTPPGWKKVVEETRPLFYSPANKLEVNGIVVRFEKV